MEELSVFVCYRYAELDLDGWMGAYIVAAPTEEDAGRRVVDRERYGETILSAFEYHENDYWPKRIVKLEQVKAWGETRILYDDYMR